MAEPVHDTPSVKAAKAAHYAAVVHDTAVHMQAKANAAAMHKAPIPFVYTRPQVYTGGPLIAVPKFEERAPVIYSAPVIYTTPFARQSMVYNHAYPQYVPTFHTLHKREAEAEDKDDPKRYYTNLYGEKFEIKEPEPEEDISDLDITRQYIKFLFWRRNNPPTQG